MVQPSLQPEGTDSMKTLGFPLAALGILALVYGGIRYTGLLPTLGPIPLATTEQGNFALLPIGGIALIGGIVLMRAPRRRHAPAWIETSAPSTDQDSPAASGRAPTQGEPA